MNAPLSQHPLEIEVEDFGPIIHAKVDLRPMTVFIGPATPANPTWPSCSTPCTAFLATLALDFGVQTVDGRNVDLPEQTFDAFEQLVQTIADANTGQDDGMIELPAPIMELLRSECNVLSGGIDLELLRCFGLDGRTSLVRKGVSTHARITVRRRRISDAAPLEQTLTLAPRQTELRTAIPEQIPTAALTGLI